MQQSWGIAGGGLFVKTVQSLQVFFSIKQIYKHATKRLYVGIILFLNKQLKETHKRIKNLTKLAESFVFH